MIILILIIIFLLLILNESIITENFIGDQLFIPLNPIPINEANSRRYIRIIGIEKNLKFDKNDRIEKITYESPKPEQGETSCYKFTCPNWVTDVVCWKCH